MSAIRRFAGALRAFHRDEGGQAMVEAAIILPIFVTTVAMTLELCVLASVKSVVNYGAYAACRSGIVHNADSTWMVTSAAMAISPVTQSNFIPVRVLSDGYARYGTWEWEGPLERRAAGTPAGGTFKDKVSYSGKAFATESDVVKLGVRTGNMAVGTLVALAHFTKIGSAAEYVFLASGTLPSEIALTLGGLSNISSLGDLETALGNLSALGAIFGALVDLQPINKIQVLVASPADSETVAIETGEWVDPFAWTTAAGTAVATLGTTTPGLLTEAGNSRTGINFHDIRSGRNPALRLRVRLIHRHMLIFPFLRGVYTNVMVRRSVDAEEEKIVGLAGLYGMVEIWGDCVMQMQSHLTLDD